MRASSGPVVRARAPGASGRWVHAAVFGTALALGGCGSSPEPATAPTTTTTSTRPPAVRPTATSDRHWLLGGTGCEPTRHRQPGGGFVAVVSCAPDSGAALGLAYEGPDDPRVAAAWPAGAPTWSEAPWSADVTSFLWAPDGARLLVATSADRGAGGFFEIDLTTRRVRQMMPAGDAVTADVPGPGYVILGFDPERQTLHYQVAPWTADDAGATLPIGPR